MASLRLVSPGAVSDSVTLIYHQKLMTLFSRRHQLMTSRRHHYHPLPTLSTFPHDRWSSVLVNLSPRVAEYDKSPVYTRLLQNFIIACTAPNRELPRTQAKTSRHPGRRPRNPQNLAICSDAISVTPPFATSQSPSRGCCDRRTSRF